MDKSHLFLADVKNPTRYTFLGAERFVINNIKTVNIPSKIRENIYMEIKDFCGNRNVDYEVEKDYKPSWTDQTFDFAIFKYNPEKIILDIYLLDIFPSQEMVIDDLYIRKNPYLMSIIDDIGEEDAYSVLNHLKINSSDNIYQRSKEFLNAVFISWFNQDDNNYTLNKNLYDSLTNKNSTFQPIGDIIRAVNRNIIFNRKIDSVFLKQNINTKINLHYNLLGIDTIEKVSERIDNLLHTGRCDRIYPIQKKSRTIKRIMKTRQNSYKKFQTVKFYAGNGKWKRVFVD